MLVIINFNQLNKNKYGRGSGEEVRAHTFLNPSGFGGFPGAGRPLGRIK